MSANITTKAALQTYLINLAKRDLNYARTTNTHTLVTSTQTVEVSHDGREYKIERQARLAMTPAQLKEYGGPVRESQVLAQGKLSDVARVLARQYEVTGVPADWLVW